MRSLMRVLLSTVRPGVSRNPHLSPLLQPLFQDASSTCKRFQSHQTSRTKKTTEPLRILFCGSDDFSCANLRALHDEHVKNPTLIESIDVVVRPGKRVGRGYKKIQHPPLRDVATELNLTIHERDTFTGWDMPSNINLIIAVSFGLFVPPRLLRAAQYGGLNVHPSLLPEFRGAAPLQHTLLRRRTATGVTLQTLDDKTFDAGVILAQTPRDSALAVPQDDRCFAVPELQAALTPLATEMLVQSLREGRHVVPHKAVGWQAELESSSSSSSSDTDGSLKSLSLILPDASACAPKITPQMRQLIPATETAVMNWSASEAVLRHRVIGPLWFRARDIHNNVVKRIIVSGELHEVALTKEDMLARPGRYQKIEVHPVPVGPGAPPWGDGQREDESQDNYVEHFPIPVWMPQEGDDVYMIDYRSRALRISHLKVEGETAKPAQRALKQFEEP